MQQIPLLSPTGVVETAAVETVRVGPVSVGTVGVGTVAPLVASVPLSIGGGVVLPPKGLLNFTMCCCDILLFGHGQLTHDTKLIYSVIQSCQRNSELPA